MKSIVFLAALPVASAVFGVDISAPLSLTTAKCMKANGVDFGIVRGWCSFGGFDSNAPGSIAAMWDAGIPHVDTYMFPCAGQSPYTQVKSFKADLDAHAVKYGQVWFDIETNPSPGCGWSSSTASNCQFMGELIAQAKASGVVPGIYASQYMWDSIMGSGCNVGAANGVALWYAHYDGSASFSDWVSFGGWSKPAMKQYSGTGSICGFSVDDNYYPA